MPEGDTIFRAARTLQKALGGATVRRFETGYAQLANVDREEPMAGRTVEYVQARGKHLLIGFSGGWALRTHMRMNGSWHIYRPGESWRRARSRARIILETDAFVAVAFDVPVAEFIRAGALERHEPLARLGPDLLAPTFDVEDAVSRLRARPELPLADALLNQSLLSGIGNVYKSEVLFAARVHPFTRIGEVDDACLRRILKISRTFLTANVADDSPQAMVTYTGYRRTTRRADPSARLWVYGRVDEPCRVCGTEIALERRGPAARSTYFCPRCQPVTSAAPVV